MSGRHGTWGMLGALTRGLAGGSPTEMALHGLHRLGEFSGARRGSIYFRDPTGDLALAGALGAPEPRPLVPASEPTSLMGLSLKRREPLFLEDVAGYRGCESLGRAAFRRDDPSCIVLPLLSRDQPTGAVNLSDLDRPPPGPGSVRRHALLHGSLLLAMALRTSHLLSELEARATRDGLTRLHNYASFYEALGREVFRAQRFETRLSLIMLDIDHFKSLNDRYGHLAGDEVLREIARRMRSALRAMDLAARYAGDEFAVILPQTPLEGAAQVARRVHEAIQREPFVYLQTPIVVTASVGVAELEQGMTAVDLVHKSDRELYRAKNTGRDRVASASG